MLMKLVPAESDAQGEVLDKVVAILLTFSNLFSMMTSSNGNLFRLTGPLWGKPPVTGGFPHKGQYRGALVFSLFCAWTNSWANNREAGDLRRHRAHHDVTVISKVIFSSVSNIQCFGGGIMFVYVSVTSCPHVQAWITKFGPGVQISL